MTSFTGDGPQLRPERREQEKNEDGERTWTKHEIDKSIASISTLMARPTSTATLRPGA